MKIEVAKSSLHLKCFKGGRRKVESGWQKGEGGRQKVEGGRWKADVNQITIMS